MCVCDCVYVCVHVCVKLDIKIARILLSGMALGINCNVLFFREEESDYEVHYLQPGMKRR